MPWVIIILGYLLGSIPTAYIAGHVLKGVDIRQVGDNNMGAANAFRQLGPKTGVAVGLIDAGKGVLVILIAQAANIPQLAVLASGFTAVIGHTWPVFIGFRGGRGVSTSIGVLLVLLTQPVLIAAVPAVVGLLIRKNVTFACALLFVPLSVLCWLLGLSGTLVAYSIALPGLLGLIHFLRTRRQVAHTTGFKA